MRIKESLKSGESAALTINFKLPENCAGKDKVILQFRFEDRSQKDDHQRRSAPFGEVFTGIITILNGPQVHAADRSSLGNQAPV